VCSRVDAASLAAFRILFGLLMAASMLRFIALGWVDEFYVMPTFHFTWDPVPWALPLPAALMHLLFAALTVLALAVAAGWHYRVCMLLFFAGFTYVELIDKTTYLNHYYLVRLLSAMLVALPAHRMWSIDARRFGWTDQAVAAWP
jgi:vitamin K-dependent gamma-carboxylase